MAILGWSCKTPKPTDPHFLLISIEGCGFEYRSQQQSALWDKVEATLGLCLMYFRHDQARNKIWEGGNWKI